MLYFHASGFAADVAFPAHSHSPSRRPNNYNIGRSRLHEPALRGLRAHGGGEPPRAVQVQVQGLWPRGTRRCERGPEHSRRRAGGDSLWSLAAVGRATKQEASGVSRGIHLLQGGEEVNQATQPGPECRASPWSATSWPTWGPPGGPESGREGLNFHGDPPGGPVGAGYHLGR